MKAHQYISMILTLTLPLTLVAMDTQVSKKTLSPQAQVQIQYIGQAVLKARKQERKALETEMQPMKQKIAKLRRELISMRQELVTPHFEDVQLSSATKPGKTKNKAQLNIEKQQKHQEKLARMNARKQELRSSMSALKDSAKAMKVNDMATPVNKKLAQKLSVLETELNTMLEKPPAQQLAAMDKLMKKIYPQKLLVTVEKKTEQPTISTLTKHR